MILTQIGAITKNKYQDMFVKTVMEIKKRGYEIVGLITGDAITEADKEYKKNILTYIHENDLDDDIFLTGFRSDVPDILSITDCVVVPSNEGLGLVAMEAMSSRTRVVGVDKGGSQELLKAAKCGELYPANGTECDIADAVLRVMKQSDETLSNGYQFCYNQSSYNYSDGIHEMFGNVIC